MTTVQLSDRLRTALIALRDIEATIQATLSNSRKLVELHPAVRARAAEIEALASNHIDAILARLSSAGDDDVAVPADPTSARSDRDWLSHLHPVSSSLRIAYALLNEAIIGYSMIQPIAVRFRDSWVASEAGTTAHRYLDSKTAGGENTGNVSEQHTRNYVAAAQEINQMIHDVVLWELGQAQDECRCTCPSCSLGVCLCAVTSRLILNSAWADTTPVRKDGILVQSPRSGSAAAIAGLRDGEVVMAADGQVLHTPPDLQSVVREHRAGEDITLRVRRKGAETLDVVVTRP